jgi:transketolase
MPRAGCRVIPIKPLDVAAHTPRRVERIGIEDTRGESAPNAWLLDRHGLTPERISDRVRQALRA